MSGKGFMGCVGFLMCSSVLLGASLPSSVRAGLYTADQAAQGKAVYTHQCAMCHGSALQGSGQNPPLAGDEFLSNWSGQTLADLEEKIRTTMPATNPGSLTPDQTTQLIAYLLQQNHLPAGKTALLNSADQLKSIQIEKPQPKP